MVVIILVLVIVNITIVLNQQSGCVCNVDRSNVDLGYRKYFFDRNDEQCPVEIVERKGELLGMDVGVSQKMILVPAGVYQVGTDDIMIKSDMEGPKRMVNLKSFYMDKYEVSNRDFISFTRATNYKTEAERYGDSFVFSLFLNHTFKEQMIDYRVVQAVWWYKIFGADWRHPSGTDSSIADTMDHPVIHVSWKDAKAYCAWRGGRLPTEAEWEAACRGGHNDTKYPWGDKFFPDRKHMANIWQGSFPNHNSAKDGFIGTNPVTMFPQNDFGFHNIAGNVWEWTEDSWLRDKPKEKVKKGGSYLCHRSYCYRYRCSARSHNTEDSSAGNLGFRCAKSA